MTDRRVAGSAPSGAEDFRGNARYQVLRCLGGGASGDVYEVFDRERGARVALKTLRHVDGPALYRFKREFRTLAGLDHPNLVSLYELVAEADEWFYTMEYVEGSDLLRYVRGDEGIGESNGAAIAPTISEEPESEAVGRPPAQPSILGPDRCAQPLTTKAQYSRLLAALRQLVDGLQLLHDAGKLHRDIKPSNVLVDRNGRLVILDLGLVAELATSRGETGFVTNLAESEERGRIVGTPAYMAPEQAAGRELGPAADWYGVGAILFEALTGQPPFTGSTIEIMATKQTALPPRPRARCPGIPRHLDELCVGLLAREPMRRLRGVDVLSQLGTTKRSHSLQTGITPVLWDAAQVLGRKQALATLHEAFAQRREDSTAALLVRGDSGTGKTSLVERFLEEVAVDEAPLVLQGRCYARESVPFGALDHLIDELSRALRRLSREHGSALALDQLTSLAHIFPVLWRVDAVASAREAAQSEIAPQELRRRAFSSFRALLRRVAEHKPIVLHLDDLQWGDRDSGEMLAEALRPPHARALLFVGCCRGDGSSSPLIQTLRARLEAHDAELAEFEIGPLDEADSLRLANALLGEDPRAAEFGAVVARESGGNPYLLNELARHVLAMLSRVDADAEQGTETAADPIPAAIEGLRLEHVFQHRLLDLSRPAHQLLSVIAAAGGPLARSLAARAASVGDNEASAFSELRALRLVRAERVRDRDGVDTYHNRVREVVLAQTAPEDLRRLHRSLALELEAIGDADPESMAAHFAAAGEDARAARYTIQAAVDAADTLAFEHSAQLYRRAIELGRPQGERRSELMVKLADALSYCGRGEEAAKTYLAAVDDLPASVLPGAAIDLHRLAAEQYLFAGHFDKGIEALRGVLASVGLRLPRSRRAALAHLLARRSQLRLRGYRFKERDPAEVPPSERRRLDVCWSAARGLVFADNLLSAVFHVRHLALALEAGDVSHVARGLAMEGGFRGVFGRTARGRAEDLLERAEELARQCGDRVALGLVVMSAGVAPGYRGEWRVAYDRWNRAADILREHRGGAYELMNTQVWMQIPLFYLGEIKELSRHTRALLALADSRGDHYTAMGMRTGHANIVWLARNDPAGAREAANRVDQRWSYNNHTIHYGLLGQTHIDLYQGDHEAAWNRIDEGWRRLVQSGLLRLQRVRIEAYHLRARVALANAAAGVDREQFLKQAERDTARIERERMSWSMALCRLLRAALASLKDRRDESIGWLRAAETDLQRNEMRMHLAAARRRHGELVGGAEGARLITLSDRWMRAQQIVKPRYLSDVLAPGFTVG